MVLRLLVIFGVIACVLSYDASEDSFRKFIKEFNKKYDDHETYQARFQIYKENIEYIESFNVKNSHMQVGVNAMSDLTHQEYLARLHPSRNPLPPRLPHTSPISPAPSLPTSVDWRNQSDVGPVLDMGNCGGPSYAVVGCVQSFCAISTGSFAYYNPLQVVQCMQNACNESEDSIFDYINTQGLHNEWTNCNVGPSVAGCCINAHLCFGNSELALETSVALMGPIVVSIDASQPSFKGYHSGVYYEPACSTTNLNLNLLVVGYGVIGKEEYWIAQNYWGTAWGVNGYILMARNQGNNCGIASHQCHPVGVHQCP